MFHATYHNLYFGSWHYVDCYHNHHQNKTFQCNTYLPFVGEYEVKIHLFLSGKGRELLESSFNSKKNLNMEWDFELKTGTVLRCNSNDKLSNNKTCKMDENYFPEIYSPKITESFNCENSNIKSVSIVREPARDILKKFQNHLILNFFKPIILFKFQESYNRTTPPQQINARFPPSTEITTLPPHRMMTVNPL